MSGSYEDKAVWIDSVLNVQVGLDDGSLAKKEWADNLAIWHLARDDAIETLDELIESVRETQDPDAAKIQLILSSVAKNLTENPDTPQAVAELRRYLESDDIITAAEEAPPQYGAVQLRTPLLTALSKFPA